jgi:hypothetical protein
MQPLLKLKPPRFNYFVLFGIFVVAIGLLSSAVSILFNRSNLLGFSVATGMITGTLLGLIIMWVYDEIKKYERWSIVLTEDSIIVPDTGFKRKSFFLSELDRPRTLAYNSERNLRNRIRYTFWSTNGASVALGILFYGRSQVNTLLEKIGLSESK